MLPQAEAFRAFLYYKGLELPCWRNIFSVGIHNVCRIIRKITLNTGISTVLKCSIPSAKKYFMESVNVFHLAACTVCGASVNSLETVIWHSLCLLKLLVVSGRRYMGEDAVGDYALSGASASMCSCISLSLFKKQAQHIFYMLFLLDTHRPRSTSTPSISTWSKCIHSTYSSWFSYKE